MSFFTVPISDEVTTIVSSKGTATVVNDGFTSSGIGADVPAVLPQKQRKPVIAPQAKKHK